MGGDPGGATLNFLPCGDLSAESRKGCGGGHHGKQRRVGVSALASAIGGGGGGPFELRRSGFQRSWFTMLRVRRNCECQSTADTVVIKESGRIFGTAPL